jgi:tellurite resistance protein TerC
MGSWPLWIGFNAGVALLLVLDLGLFHRRSGRISLRQAAVESLLWIALSLGFGAWIYFVHGRGPGLEFFAGYVVEKSLSTDNVFVFLLVFQYFRVEPRYQHRLLFWGVLGAIVLRGVMIAAGAELLASFSWTPYILGVFLLYSGSKLFGADHAVHPEKNPLVRWTQKFLPMSQSEPSGTLFVREGRRRLFTSFFIVVLVLETTDLLLAVDSIAAVFGVTRDPFIVYSSNICAILGLRALYFLLAGILQYFQYLDEGLAIAVMFVGAKMLADPWIHISTGESLAIVGGIIATSVVVSVIRAKWQEKATEPRLAKIGRMTPIEVTSELIGHLADDDPAQRALTALELFNAGLARILAPLQNWELDDDFRALVVREMPATEEVRDISTARFTVGIAVQPATFEKVRAANGSPSLAAAPADQDVIEFELDFAPAGAPQARLDILTTKMPGGNGPIARFLDKFGEGIQQVELDVIDVDRATEILRKRFKLEPIYPATRAGADGTRVNFFLVPAADNKKALLELVEKPKGSQNSFPPRAS